MTRQPGMYATFETSEGTIVCRLFDKDAPKTVANFVELAEGKREWKHPSTGKKSNDRLYDGTIFHRGPDDEGFFRDAHAVLGMRRLSIIDLAGGHQPVHNEDQTVQCVFNGEIYNYRELRDQLVDRGRVFRTRSDTEVLLHLYALKREAMVEDLRGMFAFAIYDFRAETLFIARDRVGKKPLLYAHIGDELVFGSEFSALLLHPRISREVLPVGRGQGELGRAGVARQPVQ